jgi:hypothetical protein
MPRSKILEIVHAIVRVLEWLTLKKKESDAKAVVEKSVESGDQAPIEAAFNKDSSGPHATRAHYPSVRSRERKNRKAD